VHNDIHNDTLDKIFTRLFVTEISEAHVALGRLRSEFERLRIHPSDAKIIYGNELLNRLYERSKEYEARAETAERENYVLRQHASREGLRALRVERAGRSGDRERLLEVLRSKIAFVRGWKTVVIQALNLSESEFRDYELGLRAVPEQVMDRALALPRLPDPVPNQGRRRQEPPIPEGTRVRETGPMTFDELRFIGCFFDSNDWMTGIARVANAKRKTISEWRKRGIPDNQAKVIRFRYQREQATTVAVGVQVYDRAAE